MRIRMQKSMALIVLPLLLCAALPARAQEEIEGMDSQRLATALRRMEMSSLLENLARRTDDEGLLASAWLIRARYAAPEQRDRLLEQAAELTRERADALETRIEALETNPDRSEQQESEYEDLLVAYYEARLQYMETQFLARGKTYVDRLVFLLGGEEDRKALGEITAEAGRMLSRVDRSLDQALREHGRDLRKRITLMPDLERLELMVRYNGAYVRCYAAMAIPPDTADESRRADRASLLQRALVAIEPFASDPEYGVQAQARLLKGRCLRLSENYDAAQQELRRAASSQTGADVLVEALFGLARAYIEQGASEAQRGAANLPAAEAAFAETEKVVEEFAGRAPEVHPQLGVDIKTLVLNYYLYETWRDALRELGRAEVAAEKDRQAQQAILAFLEKYPQPEYQQAVGELFREKFRGEEVSVETHDPLLVLLLAVSDLGEAQEILGDGNLASLTPDQRRQVEALHEDARVKLEGIDRSDLPAAEVAKPNALWYLGVLKVRERDNQQAVEYFREMVERFPEHPQAELAALNAVKIHNQLIAIAESGPGSVPRSLREELIRSLELYLSNWGDKPGAAKYHFDLGYQAMLLAGISPPEERKDLLDKAVANFQKVPRDDPLHDQARFFALELRYQRIMDLPDPTEEAREAGQLRAELESFGRHARSRLDELSRRFPDASGEEKTRIAEQMSDYGRWGLTAEFYGHVLGYEVLGMEGESMAGIETLPSRWPEQEQALAQTRAYVIRKRLESGEVAQALERFEDFRRQYGQEEAQLLLEEVMAKLRESIQQLLDAGGREDRLAQFRRAYLEFARENYNQKIDNADFQQKYTITLLLADALVQSGEREHIKDALEYYRRLQEMDAQRRADRAKHVREIVQSKLQEVRRAEGRFAAVINMKGMLSETMEQLGMEDWESSYPGRVKTAFDRLEEARDNPQLRTERADRTAKLLADALESLSDKARRMGTNASVIIGLAKGYQAAGEYKNAVEQYVKLVGGLNEQKYPLMYWDAQAGYAECMYELHKSSPEQMAKLAARIEQLRRMSPQMGGERFLSRFNRVQQLARQQAGGE